jgi:hypothetical protein
MGWERRTHLKYAEILNGNPYEKKPFGRLRYTWEDYTVT